MHAFSSLYKNVWNSNKITCYTKIDITKLSSIMVTKKSVNIKFEDDS